MAPSERLFHTELEATNLCNTRCLHCPHEAISRPTGRMTWETYVQVIDQIRNHVRGQRFSISYSGMGEPLLNPLLFRFIRHISDYAVTSFASNGAALTEANVAKLIEAGLDTLYLSYNGDQPELYSRMMGGLSQNRVLENIRRAIKLTRGTRLKLQANVSITEANRSRISHIKDQLEAEEVSPVTFSLCHSRGGNLRDPGVCSTPAMPAASWSCDVMRNTLFVDWEGKAHICDHDLHGEYGLGNLLTEPLATVLERRERLLADSSGLKICRECNDVMRIGGSFPLESKAGGGFREWMLYLFQAMDEPLEEATPPMRWIYQIYAKEGRTDRMVNRLLGIEKQFQAENHRLGEIKRDIEKDYAAVRADRDKLQFLLDQRDADFAALARQHEALRAMPVNRLMLRFPRWLRQRFGA